jgi:hypothetical protein
LCLQDEQQPENCREDRIKVKAEDRRTTVYLKVDEGFTDDGSFTGAIELDTFPLTETKSVSLVVQQSKLSSRGKGLLLPIMGVTTAWLVLS